VTATETYASPVDTVAYGEYRIRRDPGDTRSLYRFVGRITADGASGFRAEAGRYHIYAGWFCPWAQRVMIQRALNGLEDVVSVSYVDNARDARGWAFRERYGPDPVNGFRLLRDAYDLTEPAFDGHVSVPTLWDRETGQVLSNDFRTIGIDLATQFGAFSNGADTYPAVLAAQIDELDRWLGPAVNHGVHATTAEARSTLLTAFAELDERLGRTRYLLGTGLTEADVRLWVSLVRHQPGLLDYPNLWAYARDLYQQPAFAETTAFDTFIRPGTVLPDWSAPHGRERLA
jgi:putative glutathione S-transferase